ncbi:MAG TPA: beta/gamma crystallin-related protein, partial [Telluria sp.]|nr:beta/gamma crystallin-related protein [Telluria sp.]
MPVRSYLSLLLVLLSLAVHAGEITLYTQPDFKGREITLRDVTPDLSEFGFKDRAASLMVRSGRWEVCFDTEFRAPCTIYERGEYRTVKGLGDPVVSVRELGTGRDPRSWHRPRGARGRIELFAGPGLAGNSTLVLRDTGDFVQIGFNNRARGLVV